MIKYGIIVGKAEYDVIDMLKLPGDVQEESIDECPANDSARLINPELNPKLKKWLGDNGYDPNKCYIAYWFW